MVRTKGSKNKIHRGIYVNCKKCGKAFYAYPSVLKMGGSKFCSKKCWYSLGHSKETIKKISISKKGSPASNWKGGKTIGKVGYIDIYKPKHPFASISNGNYIREHRFILEEFLRVNSPNHPALVEVKGTKYLKPEWIVHHNGTRFPMASIEDKQDNRINNFLLFQNQGEHAGFHNKYRARQRR